MSDKRPVSQNPNVPIREGYAAPDAPSPPNVPTTKTPVSAVPPPPKQ